MHSATKLKFYMYHFHADVDVQAQKQELHTLVNETAEIFVSILNNLNLTFEANLIVKISSVSCVDLFKYLVFRQVCTLNIQHLYIFINIYWFRLRFSPC